MSSTSRSNCADIALGLADAAPSLRTTRSTPRRRRWFVRFMLALRQSRRRAAQRYIAASTYLRLDTDETKDI